MARVVHLSAPKSMELKAMDSRELAEHASKLADQALDQLPEDMRPVGVNAVALSQLTPGSAMDPGFWAEWTRACCDRRARIEDFVDPVVDQIERPDSIVERKLRGQHFESQLRVTMLEHPTEHRRAE